MRQLKLSRQLCGDRRENLGGDFVGGECVPPVGLSDFKST